MRSVSNRQSLLGSLVPLTTQQEPTHSGLGCRLRKRGTLLWPIPPEVGGWALDCLVLVTKSEAACGPGRTRGLRWGWGPSALCLEAGSCLHLPIAWRIGKACVRGRQPAAVPCADTSQPDSLFRADY